MVTTVEFNTTSALFVAFSVRGDVWVTSCVRLCVCACACVCVCVRLCVILFVSYLVS